MPVNCHGRPPGAQRQSTGNDWLTPPDLLEALGALRRARGGYAPGPDPFDLDPFDLDPCASVRQPWPTARTMWTVHEDGTAQDWGGYGEIWLNSPSGYPGTSAGFATVAASLVLARVV